MGRRNKGEILKILLDEKASKDNTICLNSYGNGIIDAITFIDKDTEYPQNKNCTCNSRTVDETFNNVIHSTDCELYESKYPQKDKLDELIEWMEQAVESCKIQESSFRESEMENAASCSGAMGMAYQLTINKAKEIKQK